LGHLWKRIGMEDFTTHFSDADEESCDIMALVCRDSSLEDGVWLLHFRWYRLMMELLILK
jgi:hypothetical protein